MSSQWERLIGQRLSEAESFLRECGIPYEIRYTRGKKDKELLTEEYVIKATGTNARVELICSAFKTKLE